MSVEWPSRASGNDLIEQVKALTFDVFGTVVDWRGSIIREGEAFGRAKGLKVDWAQFADSWRARYQPSLERVTTRPRWTSSSWRRSSDVDPPPLRDSSLRSE